MQNVINKRIEKTNLYVFSRDSDTGLFTYSRQITADEGKYVAREVTINGELGVTKEGVLYNMSTLKEVIANRKLMKQTDGKVWFPTISEGLLLHDAGLLPDGELMDFGIAVYDAKNPDKEIAQALTETARQKCYALPILASFKSLDLSTGGKRYGYTPVIVSDDGLIRGTDATDTLKKFNNTVNSGVRKLYRYWDGFWDADWNDYLDGFDEICRVGRVSAIGSEKDLKELVSSQIGQDFNTRREGYKTQISNLQDKLLSLAEQEREVIDSAQNTLSMA